MDRKYLGAAPSTISIAQNIPGAPGFNDPTIAFQPNNLGDTVFCLLHNLFDPRVLNTTTVTGNVFTYGDRYSSLTSGYQYSAIVMDHFYRIIFEEFKMRSEPPAQILVDMMDSIVDISRMLGIYLSALTMKQSRDPEMFQRARARELNNTFPEMLACLTNLPCPPNVVKASLKYLRVMDASGSEQYQNVGFLVNGGYQDFLKLYANVRSRALALSYLRTLYGELGQIGDPGSEYNSDVFEAFINCYIKTGANGFTPYTGVEGASVEAQRMASFGLLGLTVEGTKGYTVTGFSLPGNTYGTDSQRIPVPSYCRWNGTVDAVIWYSGTAQVYSATSPVTPATVVDRDLAANLGHEYNMMKDELTPATSFGSFNTTTGVIAGEVALTQENTRYRISPGMSARSLAYKYDGNIMTGLISMLLP